MYSETQTIITPFALDTLESLKTVNQTQDKKHPISQIEMHNQFEDSHLTQNNN